MQMNFMVVDIDGYDVLLGHNFLIKIGIIVHVEWNLIQIEHDPRENVQMFPLNMVNLLLMLGNEPGIGKMNYNKIYLSFQKNYKLLKKEVVWTC
jgi:hypothetical protein